MCLEMKGEISVTTSPIMILEIPTFYNNSDISFEIAVQISKAK